ncbi:hypothetical protein [uncultured Cytophaga sp.]|uniref:hypothetical protein n=1 Tax=uncultured Cytophaga sp. TaxID=160238 RepID=UPI00261287C2|nr:hypothetical protein [uncultured Cytophaga sp.]
MVILFTLPLWILAALFDSVFVGNIAAIVGLIICFAWFWTILKNQNQMLRFMRLGAIVLCIIQFMAWLTSSYIHYSENMEMKESLQTLLGFESAVSYYCIAISFVIVFAFFFALLGSAKMIQSLEQNVVKQLLKMMYIKNITLYAYIFLLVLFELLLIGSGIVGQRSIVVEGYEAGQKPFWNVFYETFLSIHIILNALLVYKIFNEKLNKKMLIQLLAIVSFLVLAFIFFSKGRSGFVFYLISIGFWYIFLSNKRPAIIKLIVLIIIVYPIISQLLLFNNFMRTKNSNVEDVRGSAIDVLPQAFDSYVNSSDLIEEEKVRSSKNLATRPLVATPLAQCIHLDERAKYFMMGDNLIHSLVWALPGALIPNKIDFPIQEELLYTHFPIGYSDTADSIYLGAYTDFGWVGSIGYPVFFLLIWVLFLFLYYKIKPTLLSYLALVAVFFQTMVLSIGEGSVLSWLVSFRTVLIFFIIDIVMLFFLFFIKRNKMNKKRH